MKIKERLTIGILTSEKLTSKSDGLRLLNLLESELPEAMPEVYGNHEPIRVPFESKTSALDAWKEPPFLWKQKKGLKVNGAVWMANPGASTAIYLSTAAKHPPITRIVQFVKSAALEFQADFSYIHKITQAEVDHVEYDMWYPLDIGVTSHDLKRGIPCIPWAMILGPVYPTGNTELLSGITVEMLSNTHSYIQLTPKLEDISEYQELAVRREIVAKHIGSYFSGHPNLKIPACFR